MPPYDARLGGSPNSANRMLSCVTVARNVVIGPPGIDIWPCDLGNGAAWSTAGGADQRFAFEPAGGVGEFYIRSLTDRGVCLDIRGASQNINTDLIRWECNKQQNQVFHFNALGPLTTRDDLVTAGASPPRFSGGSCRCGPFQFGRATGGAASRHSARREFSGARSSGVVADLD